jgi:Na+/proline symporter
MEKYLGYYQNNCIFLAKNSGMLEPGFVGLIIACYFALLLLISYLTGKESGNTVFFTANRRSPWYLVAFGMIGASLSGVTFISIPGEVAGSAWSYFQLVLGYLLGYAVIAFVLMPVYYKLNLISIYSYLDKRLGAFAYKTGAFFFLISQSIGASFRLFLVALVLQIFFFDAYGIPFGVSVITTIILIWIYTFRAGIKTIVWTDTLQTLFMLLSVILSIFLIKSDLGLSFSGLFTSVGKHEFSSVFNWDWRSGHFFFKQFFSGAFIAIVMTGLDQNMMQKNLTCRNLKEAQKNMIWFSISLLPVNVIFLSLGVLLYSFAAFHNIALPIDPETGAFIQTDRVFPTLVLHHFTPLAATLFLLGIIAAAFSSADSALAALTTSFCIDFLGMKPDESRKNKQTRLLVHICFSFFLFAIIMLFKAINDESVINAVFRMAGYTYGPLLGMFAFGFLTRYKVKHQWIPLIAILSPIISYFVSRYSEALFGGYRFGFELLIFNGLLTFCGLLLLKKKSS